MPGAKRSATPALPSSQLKFHELASVNGQKWLIWSKSARLKPRFALEVKSMLGIGRVAQARTEQRSLQAAAGQLEILQMGQNKLQAGSNNA